jgi:hypothetical protein
MIRGTQNGDPMAQFNPDPAFPLSFQVCHFF